MNVIALVGNPNSGKTALFNAITGARQQVGNWPGVTVEKKEGFIKRRGGSPLIVDLPGAYSFGSRSVDEMIARDFIVNEHPDAVINVLDATNLERNLYLTVQILEMGAPLVVALNMFDEAERHGISIDVHKLSEALHADVVPTVAVRGTGVTELLDAAVELAGKHDADLGAATRSQSRPSFTIDYGPAVESEIAALQQRTNCTRLQAIRLLESGPASPRATGSDLSDIIAGRRYALAAEIAHSAITLPEVAAQAVSSRSQRIDRVVLNPWLAYPVFFGVVWLMFQATFALSEPVAAALSGVVHTLGSLTADALAAAGVPDMAISFLVDGVIAGLGALFEFAPPVFALFFIISLLEDVGYMARAALISDRLMQVVGLHGKAFIPMILGFGCNVSGILATRSLDSRRDRLVSILVNPLISCAARLPVYVLFATAFFERSRGLVVFSLYALGIVLAAVVAKLLSFFIVPDESSTFVMELPPYRMPRLSGILVMTWERGKEFLQKAGTVILFAIIVVWALSNLPAGVEPASSRSLIGRIGSLVAPILRPAGFGTWQAAAALIFGVAAKELIIGTLGVLYRASETGLLAAIQGNWTPLSAYAFMVMSSVYIPCVATIAAIRRETGSRAWAAFAVAYTLILGWALGVLVYQVGTLIGF